MNQITKELDSLYTADARERHCKYAARSLCCSVVKQYVPGTSPDEHLLNLIEIFYILRKLVALELSDPGLPKSAERNLSQSPNPSGMCQDAFQKFDASSYPSMLIGPRTTTQLHYVSFEAFPQTLLGGVGSPNFY